MLVNDVALWLLQSAAEQLQVLAVELSERVNQISLIFALLYDLNYTAVTFYVMFTEKLKPVYVPNICKMSV